jgi:hypothetical protein
VRELAAKLEAIESRREYEKPRKWFENQKLISDTDEKKINLIRSFAIPNTKEDICEFMILAASNIDEKMYFDESYLDLHSAARALSDAWLAKFEQAYYKAKLTFVNSSDFQIIHDVYEKTNKKMEKIEKQKKRKSILVILFIVGIFSLLIILAVFTK